MAKFSTSPDMGTRKLTIPVMGEVDIVDGVIEIPEDKIEAVLAENFGIKLTPVGGSIRPSKKASQTSENDPKSLKEAEEEKGEESQVTREDLEKMTVRQLVQMGNEMLKSGLITEPALEEAKAKKKADVIDLLFNALNG